MRIVGRTMAWMVLGALALSACNEASTVVDGGATADGGGGGERDGGALRDGGETLPDGGTTPDGGATLDGGGTPMSDAGSTTDGGAPPPPPTACPDVGLDAATVYHVCDCQAGAAAGCVAGDDASAGTASSPFRTYGRARTAFNAMNMGETVAFCRGGSFLIEGQRRWVNNRCRADSPCVVRDYDPPWASGALARPILTASADHGFGLENGGNALHEEGYTFLNLDVRSTAPSGDTGNGLFFYNDVDDVLMCGLNVDGFPIGVHLAGSNAPGAGSDGRNARIVLSHSTVSNSETHGLLGGCEQCGVQYSRFDNNGFRDVIFYHNIYMSGGSDATGMFVVGNELSHSAVIGGRCTGTSLVAHGSLDDFRIEDNLVWEDLGGADVGCWGIAVDGGYGTAERFRRLVIRGNTVSNVGNVSIGVGSCEDCIIENNVVVQQQGHGGRLIAVPDRSTAAGDAVTTRALVRNNTLVSRSAGATTAVYVGQEGSGHTVVNNAIYGSGSGSLTCFGYDLPHASYATRDHNLCFGTSGASFASTSATLAGWRSASGDDASSLDVDPQFVSATPPYDFTPASGSPLVGAADPAMSPAMDRDGHARDAAPDIGAYER